MESNVLVSRGERMCLLYALLRENSCSASLISSRKFRWLVVVNQNLGRNGFVALIAAANLPHHVCFFGARADESPWLFGWSCLILRLSSTIGMPNVFTSMSLFVTVIDMPAKGLQHTEKQQYGWYCTSAV